MNRRKLWLLALGIGLPLALVMALRTARSWQPRELKLPFESNAALYASDINAFVWSPKGLLLGRNFSDAWSEPGALNNWDGQTVPIRALHVTGASFDQSGEVAALIRTSSGGEAKLDIRDVLAERNRPEVARILNTARQQRSLEFSALAIAPDGKRVAFNQLKSDQKAVVGIADAQTGQLTARVAHRKVEVPTLKNPAPHTAVMAQYYEVSALVFSPNSRQLAVIGLNNVRIVDAQNGKVVRSWDKPFFVPKNAAWSPNGQYLALSHGDKVSALSTKSGNATFLWVHDVQTGKVVRSWAHKLNVISSSNGVTNMSWAPDSQTLAWGTFDGQVLLMNLTSGAINQRFSKPVSGAVDPAHFVAYAPDGQTLAVATQSKIMLRRAR